MRKKLREIMDKEEGFTLVELLAVIVILGIIVAIAVPAVGKVISNSQTKADSAEEALIEDAARLAITSEGITETEGKHVTVTSLIENGYLELEDEEREGLKNKKGGVVNITGPGKYKYADGETTGSSAITLTGGTKEK